MPFKIAVVLSGSGVYDGAEITESTATLIHLSRGGAEIQCFAPDKPQMHVVNHLTGEPVEGETRNVLQESARIARGKILPLKDLLDATDDYDALVFPGGFGAAKNLCDFGVKGAEMSMDPDTEKVIQSFHTAKKVLGFSCISPILAAKCLPGVKITMGKVPSEEEKELFPWADAIGAARAMGAKHEETDKPCNVACVDEENKVVTCAAYMYAGKPFEIYDSIGAMTDGIFGLLKKE